MLDAVRNLCNQRFPASSLEMFAMQDQRGGVIEASMNSMHFAATTGNASTSCSNRSLSLERGRTGTRPHPHPSQVLKCPRCDSLNTKFCYYNNYNLSQPRHFCKSCRRYWTKGGVLRNIPVGGGCRKTNHNKKSKPRSNAAYTPHNRNPIPKSASNSTATVSSTESSPLTVNNDTTSSSNSSVNISDTDRTSHSHVFGSELQEILKQTEIGNLAYGTVQPEGPVPRLFSGLDYLSQPCPPNFPAAKNLSENINANSSFSSLIGSSNFVGTTFSDLQSKLQQEKTASVSFNDARTSTPLNSETLQKPSSFAELLSGYTTNNSFFSPDNLNINNNNNIIPLEWQVNDKSDFLLEEPYWWGAESQVNWLDQTQFAYPNQDF